LSFTTSSRPSRLIELPEKGEKRAALADTS
jgi:hypothetical protein